MNILRPAIDTHFLDSAIYNDTQGRCYYATASSPDYPRVVYSRVSGVPDNAFAKKGETVLIQFDLYSQQSAGPQEILTMEADLIALFDDCVLTLSGSKLLVGFQRQNIVSMEEDVSALQDGTSMIYHTCIDYEATYQAS